MIFANSALNLMAASSAGACNLMLMRQKEIKEGVSVFNEDGSVEYGKSKKAGRKAILQTALSRVILPIPVLVFPAIGNALLAQIRLLPKTGTTAAKLVELSLCICSLTFALPMSIALFE